MSNAPLISAFTTIAERVAQRTKINKMRGGTNTARKLDKVAMRNPVRSDRQALSGAYEALCVGSLASVARRK